MPRKSLRRRRRRSSKKSKKTFTKQLTKRSKSKKIRGGVTTRNGVRRGNYRFLSTLNQNIQEVPCSGNQETETTSNACSVTIFNNIIYVAGFSRVF